MHNNNKYINRSILLVAVIILTLTRISGDVIIFLVNQFYSPELYGWKTVSSFTIIISLLLYLFRDFRINTRRDREGLHKELNHDMNVLLLLSIVFLISCILIPETNYSALFHSNVSMLILLDIISIIGYISGILALRFFYKWMLLRRHKSTKAYLRVFTYGLIISFVLAYMYYFSHNQVYITIITIIYVYNFLAAIILAKRNSWISVLPRNQKLKTMGLSFLLMIFSFVIIESTLDLSRGIHNILEIFMPGSFILAGSSFIFAMSYSLRIFFSVLGSLPSSQIVEHQTVEINSLTNLNRVVANTKDFYKLMDDVAFLALNASGGIASWIEIYSPDEPDTLLYCSAQYIEQEYVQNLYNDPDYREFISVIKAPFLIDSLHDFNKRKRVLGGLGKFANSVIIVPLTTSKDRYGTLFVLHNEDYGFETEVVNIVATFNDNVSIAVENAKLLADSLEKEKYKRELMLARDMQTRLLPQALPDIKAYTISAFSIPAEEVGGDYYDIVKLKNNKCCILIGDVSGKGISASFYMAQLKGVVLAVARESENATDILCKINSTLHKTMEKQVYITMSAIVIENSNGIIKLARAGHMPALVNTDGNVALHKPRGLGIGLVNDKMFREVLEETEIKLSPGDKCLLITDGLNELKNADNKELGYNYLKQILKNTVYNNAGDITNSIKNYVIEVLGEIPQHDDMTVVSLVYQGKNDKEV